MNFIDLIRKKKYENNGKVLAALYGHLTHYVLDSKFHPYVIYKMGEYYRNKPWTYKYKGQHNKMEWELDAYFYEMRENKEFRKFKMNRIYSIKIIDEELEDILNDNYFEVFGIKGCGKKYKKGILLTKFGLKFTIEDKYGIKKKIYTLIDKFTPNKTKLLSVFSTYIVKIDESILNESHGLWYNPWNNNIKSNQSMLELYEESVCECRILFEATYKYIHGELDKEEYMKFLGRNSYVTGLPWDEYEYQDIKYIEY